MYSYKVVERALARRHQVGQDNWGQFRGRIQHLQRLGMVPASPGRGRRITYTLEHVAKWALALELGEFGIDQIVIKALVERGWNRVKDILVDGAGEDVIFILQPNTISQRGELGMFNFMTIEAKEYKNMLNTSPDLMRSGPLRCLMLNLSWIGRDLRQCLQAASHPDDNYPGAQTAYIDEASLGLI